MTQIPQNRYSVDDWNNEYRCGLHKRKWDLEWPAVDLVATVSALGLSRGLSALELGCGTGSDALFLASKGFIVTAVDVSSEALAMARRRADAASLAVEFREASVFDLPIPDATVDFATDRGCLHSLPIHDWSRYANELARVLRPGGHALLRGCGHHQQIEFTSISRERVETYFDVGRFEHCAIEPIKLCASFGHMMALLVLLRRI